VDSEEEQHPEKNKLQQPKKRDSPATESICGSDPRILCRYDGLWILEDVRTDAAEPDDSMWESLTRSKAKHEVATFQHIPPDYLHKPYLGGHAVIEKAGVRAGEKLLKIRSDSKKREAARESGGWREVAYIIVSLSFNLV